MNRKTGAMTGADDSVPPGPLSSRVVVKISAPGTAPRVPLRPITGAIKPKAAPRPTTLAHPTPPPPLLTRGHGGITRGAPSPRVRYSPAHAGFPTC